MGKRKTCTRKAYESSKWCNSFTCRKKSKTIGLFTAQWSRIDNTLHIMMYLKRIMVIGVSFYTFLNCYHRVTLEYTLSKNCYHRLEYTLSKKRLLKEISCAKHTQLKNLLFSCLAIESLHLICWKIISIAGCFNYLISSHGFFHCPQKPLLNIFTNKFDNGL